MIFFLIFAGYRYVRYFRWDDAHCDPSDKLFELKNMDANEEKCKVECSKNEKCEGFTGIWNKWCMGCRQRRFLGRCNCDNCDECVGALGFRKIEGITSKFQ